MECGEGCEVGQWSEWGTCTRRNKTCGFKWGLETRTRHIVKKPPKDTIPCPTIAESRRCKMSMRHCRRGTAGEVSHARAVEIAVTFVIDASEAALPSQAPQRSTIEGDFRTHFRESALATPPAPVAPLPDRKHLFLCAFGAEAMKGERKTLALVVLFPCLVWEVFWVHGGMKMFVHKVCRLSRAAQSRRACVQSLPHHHHHHHQPPRSLVSSFSSSPSPSPSPSPSSSY
ncbi:hypothetical protein ACEWY4_020148 [Coilia grayii]|uniref:Uncharacterized protein n=1 Tax=Coilia grayii TaxID=363190 RepID=A0ABD1JE39_9TELE